MILEVALQVYTNIEKPELNRYAVIDNAFISKVCELSIEKDDIFDVTTNDVQLKSKVMSSGHIVLRHCDHEMQHNVQTNDLTANNLTPNKSVDISIPLCGTHM
jgi:hypothetical protein